VPASAWRLKPKTVYSMLAMHWEKETMFHLISGSLQNTFWVCEFFLKIVKRLRENYYFNRVLHYLLTSQYFCQNIFFLETGTLLFTVSHHFAADIVVATKDSLTPHSMMLPDSLSSFKTYSSIKCANSEPLYQL
jgi:hypothetical protein